MRANLPCFSRKRIRHAKITVTANNNGLIVIVKIDSRCL